MLQPQALKRATVRYVFDVSMCLERKRVACVCVSVVCVCVCVCVREREAGCCLGAHLNAL